MTDPGTTSRPVQIEELQKVVECMAIPMDGTQVSTTWVRRPEGWVTLVAHVPARFVKTRLAVVIASLASDLVDAN